MLQWLKNEGETEDNDNVDMIIHGNEDDLSSSDESDENIDEEGFEDQNELRFRPPRKLLTKHRLVHDIESAINEQSHDDLHYVNRHSNWETLTGYLGPKSSKNTETIHWRSNLNLRGRQRSCDIINIDDISGSVGGLARNIETIANAFDLLFDDEMFTLMVTQTNMNIEDKIKKLQQNKEHIFESSKYTYLKTTDAFEMRAFIGFIYLCGLYKLNHHDLDILFSDKAGPPIFGAIFSRDRAKFLLASLSFITREECAINFPTDRFASARPIFEMFNASCSKYLVPSRYLTVDETLYPMRHQIAFQQYNPNKPHKYGLLCKSLNDSSFPYT